MEIKKIGQIIGGQDGAIYNGWLFRLDTKGNCYVYKTNDLSNNSDPVSQFTLDKADIIVPHSNSVVFGNNFYRENDEFPLLYSNIYNNYRKSDNKLKGLTCVYRLQRSGNIFSTTLVQLIEIGFTSDSLWCSENVDDVRPYGNFVIDTDKSVYYAFTMIDEKKCTRYFSFNLPDCTVGEYDDTFGVKKITLMKEDILDFFDCDYHRYVQGACFNDGIIYSLEGFADDEPNPPAVRLIDTVSKKQKAVYYFSDFVLAAEPEFIYFEDQNCYYADNTGNIFNILF